MSGSLPPSVQACPECKSTQLESLAPVLQNWVTCLGCGKIWPRDSLLVERRRSTVPDTSAYFSRRRHSDDPEA